MNKNKTNINCEEWANVKLAKKLINKHFYFDSSFVIRYCLRKYIVYWRL